MLFNLDFANKTYFIMLIFLIPAVNAHIFNPIAESVIPIRVTIKEAKAEMETYPVIIEAKIRKCLI